SDNITGLALSPDGKIVAATEPNGYVALVSVPSGNLISGSNLSPAAYGGPNDLAFSSDSTILAGATLGGYVYLWAARTGSLITTLSDTGGGTINNLAFSPDGKTVPAFAKTGRSYLCTEAPR